jgi:hypothetical protein
MSDYRVPCCSPNCTNPDRLIDLIDDPPLTYWQVYESYGRTAGRRPSGTHGGTDNCVYRPQDKWAHNACVRSEQSGILPGQRSLL